MIIKSVRLVNFRSHEQYELRCKKKTSLILGENGSGKTSVLEALYICMRGKSFRAVDSDILKRGADFYRVELEYTDGKNVIVAFDGEKKKFLIADKKKARLPKLDKYPVVLFLPDDLHLPGSSPTRKREYFDRVLTSLNEKYALSLRRYEKALKQRNELLKKMMEMEIDDDSQLFSWNIMLARYGSEIRRMRKDFVDKINEKLTEVYRSIADNDDKVSIIYNIQGEYEDGLDENGYLNKLTSDTKKDLYIGHTGYGVHRDNYEFMFNGVEADGSASRGEVRSVILALKFIEAKLILGETGRKPVVLLDDVFSELDEKRQMSLVKNFKENQVIITSVDGVNF